MTGSQDHLHVYCHRLTPNPTSGQARPTTERIGRPVDIGQDYLEIRRTAPVESDCGQGVRTSRQNRLWYDRVVYRIVESGLEVEEFRTTRRG